MRHPPTVVGMIRFAMSVALSLLSFPALVQAAQTDAESQASVIAAGVVELAATPSTWVIQQIASSTESTADRMSTGPGFVYVRNGEATAGPGSVQRTQLLPGNALFTSGNPPVGVTPAAGSDVYAFTLATSNSAPATPAPNRFAGSSFSPEPGTHEMVLVRASLVPDDPLLLPPSNYPAALLVLNGAISIETPSTGQAVGPLGTGGGSDIVAGDVIRAVDGPATIAAAMLLSAPSSASAPPPAPVAAAGSIGFTLLACPNGNLLAGPLESSECGPPPPGTDLQIFELGSGANQQTMIDATFDGARYSWNGLPTGEYVLNALALPAGYSRFYTDLPDGLNSDPALGYSVSPNEGYTFVVEEVTPAYDLAVYLIP